MFRKIRKKYLDEKVIKLYQKYSGRKINKVFPNRVKVMFQEKIKHFSSEIIKIKVNNYDFYMFNDKENRYRSQTNLLFKGIYEPQTAKIISQYSKFCDVFIDVGSCLGYFLLFSNAKLNIAIEPNTKNFKLLSKNIIMNKFKNIVLINKAVSDKKGTLQLYHSEIYGRHSLIEKNILEKCIGKEEVEVTTIDNILSNFNFSSVLIKIDIEGLEAELFKGMEQLLKLKNLILVFEYSYHNYSKEQLRIINDVVLKFNIFLIDDINNNIKEIQYKEFKEIREQYNILLVKK